MHRIKIILKRLMDLEFMFKCCLLTLAHAINVPRSNDFFSDETWVWKKRLENPVINFLFPFLLPPSHYPPSNFVHLSIFLNLSLWLAVLLTHTKKNLNKWWKKNKLVGSVSSFFSRSAVNSPDASAKFPKRNWWLTWRRWENNFPANLTLKIRYCDFL